MAEAADSSSSVGFLSFSPALQRWCRRSLAPNSPADMSEAEYKILPAALQRAGAEHPALSGRTLSHLKSSELTVGPQSTYEEEQEPQQDFWRSSAATRKIAHSMSTGLWLLLLQSLEAGWRNAPGEQCTT